MMKINITAQEGEGSYESIKSIIKGLREDNSTNQIFVLDYINEIPFNDAFFKGFERVYNIETAINSHSKYIIVKTNEQPNKEKIINDTRILILAKNNVINCNKKSYLIMKENNKKEFID